MKKQIFLIMGIIPMVYGGTFISRDCTKYGADLLMQCIHDVHEFVNEPISKEPTMETVRIFTPARTIYTDFLSNYSCIVDRSDVKHKDHSQAIKLYEKRLNKLTQDSLATFLIPMPMICQIRNHLFKKEKTQDIILALIKIWIECNVKTKNYTTIKAFLGVYEPEDQDYTLQNYIDDQLNQRYFIFGIGLILFLCAVFYTKYYITSLVVFCIYIALVIYINKNS